ncbi:hypothetical protein JTB14_028409 [Gonioctena quinquepunctata]|nr:hypothetical protein JTB14_028409 [Gonioctena quinquepunctata]
MDPVLQRFGDVTIQRLEKPKEPKVGPQNVNSPLESLKESKDENYSDLDEESEEEPPMPVQSLKRPFPPSEITMKKFKYNSSGVSLEKKIDELNNFSETELSEYDTDSEMDESEGELNELNTSEVLNSKPVPNTNNPTVGSSSGHRSNSELPSNSEDEASSSTSFFEKLVEQVEAPSPSVPSKPPETVAEEEYDIDIKEKLKEMGEISFETVKKGEKPKKTEVAVENEVVVTPAKKFGVDGEELPNLPKGIALRRNIREVMDETKLDESTLAAQRQEAERLRRVQEQQRLLRELQRQAAQERMQHKVISMLQGNQFSKPGPSTQTRIGNTVLDAKKRKCPALPPMSAPRSNRSLLVTKKAGPGAPPGPMPGADLTPSVSIAPVSKKFMPPTASRHSDSDSESEDRKMPFSPPPHRPKRAGKPVPPPTIDISSDDDCIVVSEPEGEEDEPDDDPSNSGMHTNDQFNQPDEKGRVLVNVGHPEGEPDIFVAPQIARIIKPHQIGGVRFLYDNVVESTSRFESSSGFGCILAHSMGLGKTLQIVTFADIFLRNTPARTILCIMPINTLQNWMAEFNMWLPKEEAIATCPLHADGEVRPRNFQLLVLNDSHKTLVARAKVIHEWKTKGGVLLIGYEQFRLLSSRKITKSRKKASESERAADDDKNRMLFDEVHAALIKPGPDLVICDEGHRIKNSHASISQALKQIGSKRRVVLTGYPLQNNLMEYWCMVDFVRPNYLGSKTEFCNMFERPIMNGQCIDSTEADIKLMRYRAHVLHSLLLGFVQRRSHRVLQTALPQKEEYVLLVRLSPFQRTLYEMFMNEVVRIQAVPNPLKAFAVCCKIWNHPDVLYNFLKKRACGEAVDIDLEEVGGAVVNKTVPEKPEKPPARANARRKAPAKGKNGKPAASVTPYNSSTDPSANAASAPISSAGNINLPNSSPITSFSNTISQHGKDTQSGFSQSRGSTNLQDISHSFPETIPQPYYDQEFDQNAQFPSSFPNTDNYSYPNTPNSNSNYNNVPGNDSNFNLSEHNQPSKSTFLNLDSQHPVPELPAPSQNSNSFANLSAEISLTPLTSKTKESQITLTPLSNANSLTPLNNASTSLTPLNNASTSLTTLSNANTNLTALNNASTSLTPLSSTSTSLIPLSSASTSLTTLNSISIENASSSLTPLTNASTSLTPLRNASSTTLTSLNNAGNSFNSPSNVSTSLTPLISTTSSALASLNNMLPGSEDLMEIGNTPTQNDSRYGQNQYNPNENEYQDYQQNYWNQQDNNPYNQEPSNYFGPPNNQFNPNDPNVSSGNANLSWMKTEDTKPVLTNLVSPKSETSNESKPKIKIISDIKLPSVFNSPDKKIKILSDIKIEPKQEEMDDLMDIKPSFLNFESEIKTEMIDEIKSEFKSEIQTEVRTNDEMKPPSAAYDNIFARMSSMVLRESKEDSGIPYDWALDLIKDYRPGCIENSFKFEILFCIIRESVALGDRLLAFSQSLITLDVIEQFLQMNKVPGETFNWAKNVSYYRLDGSTSALEREKLINEFNSNPKILLFLVSTRAGSLGINLIGANRVVVLDASWNPCHDTQAVCRVYRYGQRKPCFVYRLVADNCLEKKIYDRQINKQGMSDRVVDECNPDAHLTMKDVSTLCWDDKRDDNEAHDYADTKDNYIDVVLQKVLDKYGRCLNKEPFQHESLLVDRKEKQLSQQEKRLAKKGYEREKQASRQPPYNLLGASRGHHRPVASVRPMQQGERPSRWIPAEHWQRQGMTAQEMTLPLDVVIPTNQPEKGNIVLKAGQKVLVLKSPKGVYMQLESGKIVAIKTAIKVKGKADEGNDPSKMSKPPLLPPAIKGNPSLSVMPQKRPSKAFTPGTAKFGVQSVKQSVPNLVSRIKSIQKKAGKTKPQNVGSEIAKSLNKDHHPLHHHHQESMTPFSSSDDEHHFPEKPKPPHRPPQMPITESADDIQKRISLLKRNISIQRVTSHQPPKTALPPQHSQQPPVPSRALVEEKEESSPESSVLEQLEHSASSVLNDNIDNNPFQDTLDSITSAYQATNDENMESFEDDMSETSDQKQHEQSEISDQSDEVTYVSDQSPQYPQSSGSQQSSANDLQPKTENPEYGNYNNYYNYNAPPYPGPPPPQGYAYPPQPHPPYDMMGYPPQPQQPQYNYGYQGYPPPPPPQPHYPPPPPAQQGYDYNNPPPAQPMYGGYHNPYPQQYPPPPPAQNIYPPPASGTPAPPYTDYQQQYPVNTAPPPAPFYPNS